MKIQIVDFWGIFYYKHKVYNINISILLINYELLSNTTYVFNKNQLYIHKLINVCECLIVYYDNYGQLIEYGNTQVTCITHYSWDIYTYNSN